MQLERKEGSLQESSLFCSVGLSFSYTHTHFLQAESSHSFDINWSFGSLFIVFFVVLVIVFC